MGPSPPRSRARVRLSAAFAAMTTLFGPMMLAPTRIVLRGIGFALPNHNVPMRLPSSRSRSPRVCRPCPNKVAVRAFTASEATKC